MSDPQNQLALSRDLDNNTWSAIKEIYDGASDEKIALVVDYCKARKLDPLKKPVHIVPVWSNRRKCMVETVWPSVSEVRITAMRTGQFAGQDATTFGPDKTERVGNAQVTFPEYAQVTVYRIVQGQARPFPGPICRWKETYANRGKDDASPNATWAKRPYAQLEKCAEAAALRRAFPEESSYTAEEMHGKEIDPEAEGELTTETKTDAAAEQKRADPKPRKSGLATVEKPKDVTPPAPPTPENKPEAAKNAVVEAEIISEEHKPQTAGPRTELKDGEKVAVNVRVAKLTTKLHPVGGKPTPMVIADVTGEYAGKLYHINGARVEGETVVPIPPWKDGAEVTLKVFGKAIQGRVYVYVESITTSYVPEAATEKAPDEF